MSDQWAGIWVKIPKKDQNQIKTNFKTSVQQDKIKD